MDPQFDQRRYLIPFRSLLLPHVFTDTLVIGGGVAGASAAIAAAAHGDVILLAKDSLELSSTAWAQGGIAAALGDDDTPADHVGDTLAAGAGLCEPDAVRVCAEEGPDAIRELVEWGMVFDRDDAGAIHLTREGGHTRNRVAHSRGDATGAELVRCLVERLRGTENVR
ncbi:MAG: FAD-dependent oxidoreductase, partial [Phycisphaerales bacterium]|nr:FAD-dependent oxidoreductase [Phycisphaerales bacterium]